jgi:hypothetical protein
MNNSYRDTVVRLYLIFWLHANNRHILIPYALKMTKGAVNIMPDGSYFAVVRQDGGSKNLSCFTKDSMGLMGQVVYMHKYTMGATLNQHWINLGTYYMGWQSPKKWIM